MRCRTGIIANVQTPAALPPELGERVKVAAE
jgi:hypothetical protein